MHKFDFVPKNVNETLNRSFFFDKVVSESRSVDNGKLGCGHITEEMTLVLASLFCDWSLTGLKSENFEAAVLEPETFVIFVSAHQHVG